MWETLINLVGTLFSTLFPMFSTEKTDSEYLIKYKQLRYEISEALARYGYCCRMSLDWNENGIHKLPKSYMEGKERFRQLSAQICALAETMPEKKNDVPVLKEELAIVSEELHTLSLCVSIPVDGEEEQLNKEMSKEAIETIKRHLSLKM